ncbi:protein kinase [Bacillus sp. FJAT-47783]|uniref:serine/threonine protein kinase n=1 Tax=Bacillus sp. FJAT-47783 TaxID=2922712 RepID=UPI001FABA079|nr:protein kinase [Bacillus sp. FJAT-47783]
MVGDYQISRFLGIGSYGITYVGQSHHSKEEVVIKQLRKHKRYHPKGIQSFQTEKEMLNVLDHPSIPTFLEEIKTKKHHFIIMEYKKGQTFEEKIFGQKTKYSETDAFYYLWKVLQVVKYLHSKGIVHRDLRIPNILVDGDTIHLIDFGLARRIHDIEEQISQYEIEKRLMREIRFESDFYALGHLVLFLLYSTYEPKSNCEEQSWEKELVLTSQARYIIRKLLMIEQPYQNIHQVIYDVQSMLLGGEKHVVLS